MSTAGTPFDPLRTPAFVMPAGACDSHFHVIGPADRFPYVRELKILPPLGTKEMLFALHRRLGVHRGVIVQSVSHGFDNAVTEDAIRAGEGRYAGIALVPLNVADAELKRLANARFRGVRFHFMCHLKQAAPIDRVVADLTPRLAMHGLHLQIHIESPLIHEVGAWLARSAVPVVIDHIGRVDAALGPGHADFAALHGLLRDGRIMVKVSGVDRIDRGWPYEAGVALARILVDDYPHQCLWGTDWPHPNHHHQPDDAALVDLLPSIATTAARRAALLVDNPLRLYRFEA